MRLIKCAFVLFLLIGCGSPSSNDLSRTECVKDITERIENVQINDTLNFNLDCIEFDKVIIMSHEINSQFLFNEIKLSKDSQDKIKTKTDDYNNHNWAIAWVNDSTLVNKIEFSPTTLMLDNLVGGKGYTAIDRAALSPLLVISTDQVFVSTQDTILDVKAIY